MLGLVWYFISNFCILFHLISQRDTVSIIKLTLWYWTQRDFSIRVSVWWYWQYLSVQYQSVKFDDTDSISLCSVLECQIWWYWQYLCVQYQSVKFDDTDSISLDTEQRDTISIIKLDTLILNTERYCQYHQTWYWYWTQRDTISIIKLTLWYWTQRDTVSIIKLDTFDDTDSISLCSVSECQFDDTDSISLCSVSECQVWWYW
jgi:hypothetical protein